MQKLRFQGTPGRARVGRRRRGRNTTFPRLDRTLVGYRNQHGFGEAESASPDRRASGPEIYFTAYSAFFPKRLEKSQNVVSCLLIGIYVSLVVISFRVEYVLRLSYIAWIRVG